MEKVLVNLWVPCLERSFDIYLPMCRSVKEISMYVADMLVELTNQRYVPSGREILCSAYKNIVLQEMYTLEEYAIANGECLMFF